VNREMIATVEMTEIEERRSTRRVTRCLPFICMSEEGLSRHNADTPPLSCCGEETSTPRSSEER